ncbi:MAG: hypothetical protein AB1349_07905 [Elusimicrobiota bacterium]
MIQGIDEKHYLKSRSSFIVVVLRSLAHKGCVCCSKPLKSLEESADHWAEKIWGQQLEFNLEDYRLKKADE